MIRSSKSLNFGRFFEIRLRNLRLLEIRIQMIELYKCKQGSRKQQITIRSKELECQILEAFNWSLTWSTRWWGVACQVLESKVYKFEICKAWFQFPNLDIQILQLARQLKIKWLKPSNFNNPHCTTTLKQNWRSKRKKLETYLENWTLALYNIELDKLGKLETTPILKWCSPPPHYSPSISYTPYLPTNQP